MEAQQVRRIDACYRTFACALQQKGAGQAVFDTSTEAAVRRALDQYFKQPSLEELQEAPGGAALPFEPMPTQIRGDIQLLNRMGVSTLGHQDLSGAACVALLLTAVTCPLGLVAGGTDVAPSALAQCARWGGCCMGWRLRAAMWTASRALACGAATRPATSRPSWTQSRLSWWVSRRGRSGRVHTGVRG